MLACRGFSGVGFQACRGDLILEKNEHSFVARKPGVYLCEQIIYAPSTDIDLAAVSLCDEGQVQRRLGTDYCSISCTDVFIASRIDRSLKHSAKPRGARSARTR